MSDDPIASVLMHDDVARFMKSEGVDFIEAVERLAARRGYVKPKQVTAVVVPFPVRERV